MTKKSLSYLKSVTTWSGVGVTLSGVGYNLAHGGSRIGAYISLFGVFITSAGHIIGSAIARRDKEERQRNEERLKIAEDFAHELGDIADDAAYLRKVIKSQKQEDFIRGFNGDDWK